MTGGRRTGCWSWARAAGWQGWGARSSRPTGGCGAAAPPAASSAGGGCWGAGSAGCAPGVGQSPLYQLVAVAVAVHLGPVVLRGAGQVAHGRGGVGSALGHDGLPLVRTVRVLLHVLGKVGLLCVALATVGTDVRIQVL